jgi:class 3 adenylate cyclase
VKNDQIESRRLSTILFADIEGYTSLMQTDEQLALHRLNLLKETLENLVPLYQGQIVQYFGDACLLSFESATQGVQCAIALQKKFIAGDLPMRMGLHLGDVVFRNNNVFGDGVNIASRIESIGISGAILISRAVKDQIQNKAEFLLASLGAYNLKNVTEPVEIYAIANDGFVVPTRREVQNKLETAGPKKKKQSFILPLVISLALMAGLSIWYLVGRTSNDALDNISKSGKVALADRADNNLDTSTKNFLSIKELVGPWEFYYFYANDSTLIYRGDLTIRIDPTGATEAEFAIKAPRSSRAEKIGATSLDFSNGHLTGELTHQLYKIKGGHMLEQFSFTFSDPSTFTGSGRCVAYCAEGTEEQTIMWHGTKSPN